MKIKTGKSCNLPTCLNHGLIGLHRLHGFTFRFLPTMHDNKENSITN